MSASNLMSKMFITDVAYGALHAQKLLLIFFFGATSLIWALA
jgi:hypothetical protein